MGVPAAGLRRSARVLCGLALLACAAPASASAALARIHGAPPPAQTLEARELAKIGYAVVPDGTPGSTRAGVLRPALVPDDPYYQNAAYQWVYTQPRFVDAWSVTLGDPSVVIAIVDTGVDSATADLQGALLPGYNFYDGNTDTSDPHGHGTAVASLAAARTNNGLGIAGACGRCSILPVRVAAASGYATWPATAAGIVWAADRGARVISISLIGYESASILEDAVSYAQRKGSLVVAAAGNDGRDRTGYPAALPGVISVEAVDENNVLYAFSNHGSSVTLAAAGCAMVVYPGNAYRPACGTSLSTPLVAGAAALLASAYPGATAQQLARALESGAARVSDSRYGRLDVANAFAAVPVSLPPVLLGAPSVTGSPVVGATLTATAGSWTGGTASFAYQWLRCANAECSPIPDATQPTYTIAVADAGHRLQVQVVASNAAGQVVGVSPATTIPPFKPVKRTKAPRRR